MYDGDVMACRLECFSQGHSTTKDIYFFTYGLISFDLKMVWEYGNHGSVPQVFTKETALILFFDMFSLLYHKISKYISISTLWL